MNNAGISNVAGIRIGRHNKGIRVRLGRVVGSRDRSIRDDLSVPGSRAKRRAGVTSREVHKPSPSAAIAKAVTNVISQAPLREVVGSGGVLAASADRRQSRRRAVGTGISPRFQVQDGPVAHLSDRPDAIVHGTRRCAVVTERVSVEKNDAVH